MEMKIMQINELIKWVIEWVIYQVIIKNLEQIPYLDNLYL